VALMPLPLAARQRRALARAFAWGLQAEVRPVDPRHWRVPSVHEPGLLYDVALTRRDGQEHLACSCPAGVAGQPCSHAAAVWLFRTEQRTGGNIVAVRPA
jgi:hypothetical protein